MEIAFYYNEYKLWELYIRLKKYHELCTITGEFHDRIVVKTEKDCYPAIQKIAKKFKL